ncbi:MAG: hypothetical protein Tsb0019_15720 [Roseibium sp.]
MRDAGMAYKKGKGGILVADTPEGFVLHAISARDKPRNWTKQEVLALRARVPQYAAALKLLSHNADSMGRAEILSRHLDGNTHVVSLDSNVPNVPARKEIDALEPGKIPKAYMGVDLKAGTVSIVLSEMSVERLETPSKSRRPDLLVMQLDLDKEDLRKLDQGADLETIVRSKNFDHARVLYYDDNQPLSSPKSAGEHHRKSIRTMHSGTRWILDTLELKFSGVMEFHAADQWRDPPAVVVDRHGAQAGRDFTPDKSGSSSRSRDQVFTIWQTVAAERQPGGEVSFQNIDHNLDQTFSSAMHKVKALEKVMERSLELMAKAVKKL